MPPGIWRKVLFFVARLVRLTLPGRGTRTGHSLSLYEINPASVPPGPYLRRRDMEGRDCLELAPDRRRLWGGVGRALLLWLRFIVLHRRAARRWQAGAMRYCGHRAWAARFAE